MKVRTRSTTFAITLAVALAGCSSGGDDGTGDPAGAVADDEAVSTAEPGDASPGSPPSEPGTATNPDLPQADDPEPATAEPTDPEPTPIVESGANTEPEAEPESGISTVEATFDAGDVTVEWNRLVGEISGYYRPTLVVSNYSGYAASVTCELDTDGLVDPDSYGVDGLEPDEYWEPDSTIDAGTLEPNTLHVITGPDVGAGTLDSLTKPMSVACVAEQAGDDYVDPLPEASRGTFWSDPIDYAFTIADDGDVSFGAENFSTMSFRNLLCNELWKRDGVDEYELLYANVATIAPLASVSTDGFLSSTEASNAAALQDGTWSVVESSCAASPDVGEIAMPRSAVHRRILERYAPLVGK